MPIKDKFENWADEPNGASTDVHAVTPSDSEDLPFMSRFIFVGTGGTLMVVPADKADDNEAVPIVCGNATTLPLRAVRIHATGTDAADIVIMN